MKKRAVLSDAVVALFEALTPGYGSLLASTTEPAAMCDMAAAEIARLNAELARKDRVIAALGQYVTCPHDAPFPCEDRPEPTEAECRACTLAFCEAEADKKVLP